MLRPVGSTWSSRSSSLLAASVVAFSLHGVLPSADAQTLQLHKGEGVEVCDAYKNHLERYIRLERVLACGDRFFDQSSSGMSAPRWRRLDFKSHRVLYKNVQAYQIAFEASAHSWSKGEIARNVRIAEDLPNRVDTAMWVTAVDFDLDGSAEYVLALQQGACMGLDDLRVDEVAAGHNLGVDLERRFKERKPGGVVYLVDKALTNVDQATHERFLGTGGNAFGVFLFQARPYIDAFDAQEKAKFFGPGTFTVMDPRGGVSVCEVEYKPR